MKAELITIGDELLIGKTINTNAAWLGVELTAIGASVCWNQTISDERASILNAFDLGFSRSDLIIVTGGLGPTKDDITKHVLCEYFDTKLEINQTVLEEIEQYFSKRNRPMLESNIQQAALPKSCEVVPNKLGTASGMWFEKNHKILVSLPGVPYEMKGIMETVLLSKIQKHFQLTPLVHKTILTTGIGESFLAEKMKNWENSIRNEGLSLAYLPDPGIVKLRISSKEGFEAKGKIENYFIELTKQLPQHVFGFEKDTLAAVVGQLLLKSNKTLSTVESCTAGGIANEIVSIPGSSEYYKGSIVAYSYELKSSLVDVNEETIIKYGAVSEETALEMVKGGLKKMKTDFCIATTGIAGPDGGTPDKPVGTVWIAIASEEKIRTKCFNFGDNRERNMKMTIYAALNFLRVDFLNHSLN
jgi:nicotinamide-nucleotide amidase